MPFKIVKTIENGKVYVTAVPDAWEKNNLLYWPSHLNDCEINKLRRNENSSPNTNWVIHECELKEGNIEHFSAAINIEKLFCECTDTESEEMIKSLNKKKSKHVDTDVNLCNLVDEHNSPYDYNSHLEDIVRNTTSQNQEEIGISAIDINASLLMKIDSLQLENRMQKLEQETAKQNAKLDKILSLLEHICDKLQLMCPQQLIQDDTIAFKFPFDNIEDLKNFEESLKDENFRKKMISKFSSIGGRSGKETGRAVAYKLIDGLISRHLLKQFTWTGLSKTNNKLSFSALINFNKFFATVVSLADNRFTEIENEKFFKDAVLKHSTVRAVSRPNKRQSTPRARAAKSNNEHEESASVGTEI